MLIKSLNLNIGDIKMKYSYSEPIDVKGNEPMFAFLSTTDEEIFDMSNNIVISDSLEYMQYDKYDYATMFWNLKVMNNNYYFDVFNQEKVLAGKIIASNHFKNNTIYIKREIIEKTKFLPSDIHSIITIGYLSFNNFGLLFHGSAIEYKNEAIIFSGKSGSGKSTLSSIFSSRLGYKIFTDDRVLLKTKSNKIICYSTPYDWKIERCLNISMPLRTIFFLKHGKENKIIKLSDNEKFKKLISSNLLPFYIPNGMTQMYNALYTIIKYVNIWEYEFLPDKSSAEFIEEFMNSIG